MYRKEAGFRGEAAQCAPRQLGPRVSAVKVSQASVSLRMTDKAFPERLWPTSGNDSGQMWPGARTCYAATETGLEWNHRSLSEAL